MYTITIIERTNEINLPQLHRGSGEITVTSEERRRRDQYLARKRRRKRKRTVQIIKRCTISCACVLVLVFVLTKLLLRDEKPESVEAHRSIPVQQMTKQETKTEEGFQQKVIEEAPDFTVDLLTPNQYSRPQMALKEVKGIVVHYTANPGTTAEQNRSYFESLKETQKTKASSHFVVGIDGKIIQCIPSSEICYASNERNEDTLAIECCHQDETGKFTQETYDSLVELTAWLCGKFNLPVESVIRHYDVTGKDCPIYYVEHEDAWVKFKEDVQKYLDEHGTEPKQNLT